MSWGKRVTTFRDRLGRVITDPATIEARQVARALRKLVRIGVAAGRHYDQAVTVGDLSVAMGLTPARIVEIIREYEMWRWGLTERAGDIAAWWVWEDGE